MNISSSQCGIGLKIENPRMRERPSSALTWMSFITSGVKMRLCPSTFCREEVLSEGIASSSLENELPLGRLEVVVVGELLAAHELLELGRGAGAVDAGLSVDVLRVGSGPLAGHAVDA